MQRGERDEGGGGVRSNTGLGGVRADGLAQARHRNGVRLIERHEQTLGEAACCSGRRGRRTGGLRFRGRPCCGGVTRGQRRDRGRRSDDGIRYRAEPAEQVVGLRGTAVVQRDARRDPHRRSALGRVLRGEQLVGESGCRRAVPGQCERIRELRAQRGGAGIGRRTVEPRGACRMPAGARGEIGQRGGQPFLAQTVLGQAQREVGCQRRQFELRAQHRHLDIVMSCGADDLGDTVMHRAQEALRV